MADDVRQDDGADTGSRKRKKSRNPFKAYREYRLRKKLENERLLLAREERMKEDLERYLMQMEEQRCWLAYHLRHVNAQRMKKLQILRRVQRNEQNKDSQESEDNMKEDGLSYYQGNVVNYKRWQNSPAKYRDFVGHKDAITACRLSPCGKYVLSCSADTTMKIWDLASAECIKTYTGHAKVVNDADLHPKLFKMYSLTVNIVSASGDGTLRLWNTSDTKPITTIFAHQSAVYRCQFSPDGNTIMSCSEDKTIRSWNYPEGYNVFIYSAHHSPVISLRYSPSGKFFVSGSDYGERRIILWDAKLPHMYEPAKFPHIIYWTTTGLIRKIIIRRDIPRPGFWLAQNQLTWISSDKNLDIWAGEMSDDDNFAEDQDSDGEGDDDDDDDDGAPKKVDKVDKSREGDVYEKEGVFINVLQVGKQGEKDSAVEYNPGGSLIVKIQSMDYYIEEAYMGAFVKDKNLDIYSEDSGRKAGAFVIDAPIPWLPMLSKLDGAGRKVYYRAPPDYVSQSKDGVSVNYLPERGKRKIPEITHPQGGGGGEDGGASSSSSANQGKDDGTVSTTMTVAKDGFELVWNCPEPLLGTVVLVFNFKLKDYEDHWIQLRYSMKESPIRVGEYATVGDKKDSAEAKQYKFNQEKKHINFWQFIRDKNWTAAASYVDKYAIAWVRDDVIRRRYRIMNLLVSMFEDTNWLILHSPFQFKPGVTKSVVLCETDYGDYGADEDEDEGGGGGGGGDGDAAGQTGKTNDDDDDDVDANDDNYDESMRSGARAVANGGDDDEGGGGGGGGGGRRSTGLPTVHESPEEEHLETARPARSRATTPTEPSRLPPEEEIPPPTNDKEEEEDKPIEPTIEYRYSGSVGQQTVVSGFGDSVDGGGGGGGGGALLHSDKDGDDDGDGGDGGGGGGDDDPDEPWLEKKDDLVATAGRFRPQTQNQHLPSILFAGTEQQKLDHSTLVLQASKAAEEEVERILSLLQHPIDILGELPMQARRGAVLQLFPKAADEKLLGDGSQQIAKVDASVKDFLEQLHVHDQVQFQAIDYDLVMEAFDGLLVDYQTIGTRSLYDQSVYAQQLQAKATLFPSTLESMEGAPVVKSGRYGPEIDEFSIPLPPLYPQQAGGAKYALRPALEWFQRVLRKLQVESLPRTMEEVYEPTWREQLRAWYHRLNRTQEKTFREQLTRVLKDFCLTQLMQEITYVSTRRPTYHQLPGLVPHYPNPYYSNPAVVTPDIDYPPPPRAGGGGVGGGASFVEKLLGRPVIKSIVVPPVGRRPDKETAFALQKTAYLAQSQTSNRGLLRPQKSQFQVNVLDNLVADDDDNVEAKRKKLHRAASKGKASKSKSRRRLFLQTALTEYPSAFFQGRRAFYHQLPGLEDVAWDAITLRNAMPIGDEEQSLDDDEEFEWEAPPGFIRAFAIKDGLELAHHGAINDVVFSPSELRLASAGGDRLVKIWDPRDGSFVRSLSGHDAEVVSVRFTGSEQFLISAGGDAQIIIWSLLTQTIQRRLRGHVDVITMLDLVPDGSLLLSASQDHTLKTWCTTPRHPVAPEPPKIISFTEHSVYIGWTAPPSFNCDINAFHYQLRVGTRGEWTPPQGQSIAPHLRNRVVDNIIPATPYQFRLCAENAMGRSEWSPPSALVRTAFGLPEPVEKPYISLVSRTTQHIVWFTPNPTTYGSAATGFEVQYAGNGQGYDDHPTLTLDLASARAFGERVVAVFRKIRQRREDLQHKLIKSQQFHMKTRQLPADKADYEVSDAMSSETVFEILDRVEEESFLLVGCEVAALRPGFLYTIRVRGSNVVGLGGWSVPTLSTATKPTMPDAPHPPRLAQATLRALTFQWDPPHDDGGSAITGYRLHLVSVDRYVELPRSSVTYRWNGLFPGRSYRCRVLAKNGVGESPYSECNAEQDSYTQTAPPDAPVNALAVEGTWSALVYEVDIPYHNGARVTHMEYEYRRVEPFTIGEWMAGPRVLSVQDTTRDVTFVHRVDLDQQQEDMEASVRALELAARSMKKASGGGGGGGGGGLGPDGGASASTKSKRGGSGGGGGAAASSASSSSVAKKKTVPSDANALDQQIEAMILSQRPVGHRIRFTVEPLDQDAMYEVRIRFINAAGTGAFSAPSHRAKTNKAALPGGCACPEILTIGHHFLLLELVVPAVEGGAAIRAFHIENMDLDDNRTTVYKCLRNSSITGTGLSSMESYRMENLIPGHSYLLRCRAESAVGFGPFSPWTKEVSIPLHEEENDAVSVGSNSTGRSSMTGSLPAPGAPGARSRSVESIGSGHGAAGATSTPGIALAGALSRVGSTDTLGASEAVSALSSPTHSVASSRTNRK